MPATECPNCERRLIYAADLKSISCFYCFASFDVADARELGEDRRRDSDAVERVRPNDDGTLKTLLAVGIGFCSLVAVVSAMMLSLSLPSNNADSIRLETKASVARINNDQQLAELYEMQGKNNRSSGGIVWGSVLVVSLIGAGVCWLVRRTL